MMTKGKMIIELKKIGVRKSPEGKKLESCKSYVVCKLYFDNVKGAGEDNV